MGMDRLARQTPGATGSMTYWSQVRSRFTARLLTALLLPLLLLPFLTLAVAGWARYLRGYDLKGQEIRIDDPQSTLLTRLATMEGNNPGPLLQHEIFTELRLIPAFTERFGDMIADIDEQGVIPTLRRALRSDAQELAS